MAPDIDTDDTSRSPWTQRTAEAPFESNYRALCVHPVTGRATLAAPSPRIADGGTFELWAWAGGRWERTHARLSPARGGEAQGSTVVLFTHHRTGTLRLGRVNPGGELVLLDPDRPDDERRVRHPSLPAHAPHTWAWEDPRRDGVWLLTNEAEAILFELTDEAITEVARGPYALGAAFDPARGEILAVSVTGVTLSRLRVPGGRWEPLDRPHPRLDALFFDRSRDAACGFEVTSERRMECFVRGPGGWARREPPLWVPTYRNGVAPVVDEATGETLAHGGQDFARWGASTHETFFGRDGAMRDTHDAALPTGWSAYGSLLTTEHGLLAVDHQSLRVQRREGARWEPFGRATIDGEAQDHLDCRMLNLAWGDGALWVLDPDGRLVRWRPDGDVSVTLAPPAKEPGAAYAHRVAMGWDASTGCFAVFRGDRKRALHRHRGGAWRVEALPDAPVAGVATGLGTAAGLYVLSRNALHLLQAEAWVKVAPAPSTESAVLRHDPARDALLAATQEGVFAWAEGGWRIMAALPDDARLRTATDGDMELGVDPRRDELVLMNGRSLWALPLAALDLRGCALPTAPPTKKPVKKRGG